MFSAKVTLKSQDSMTGVTGGLQNDEVVISANREGLISLANHLLNLAQTDVPCGTHIHLDENNSLEDGSQSIIIEKI